MSTTRFEPSDDLILVWASVWGPLGCVRCRLALDTGSTDTILDPGVLDDLGYSPRDAAGLSRVTSMLGEETGYRKRVQKFRALGYESPDFEVRAHDMPESQGLDGLLGLSFLRRFNYEVRSAEGLLVVSPA
ncbi:MAG: retropepsin-like domain-containing protein [Candidatus Riflebacteria bacterium]|nr:retropepsin-like domain-containing protein [Candidatus Riflebacteria bacterium]